MSKVQTAYQISLPTSERGSEDKGIFLNRDIGLSLYSGKGWYGSSAEAFERKVIQDDNGDYWQVSEKVEVNVAQDKQQALREHALSKLSVAERRALGF